MLASPKARSRLIDSASTRNSAPSTIATSSTGPSSGSTSGRAVAGSTASKSQVQEPVSRDSARLKAGTAAPSGSRCKVTLWITQYTLRIGTTTGLSGEGPGRSQIEEEIAP
jgi:hypothetical protein